MRTFEEREAHAREIASSFVTLLRTGPLEPMATQAEVLEIACSSAGCGAGPGEECRTAFPHPAFTAGVALGAGWAGVHLRRYLDKTGDPR
jgi:hypothetical protein